VTKAGRNERCPCRSGLKYKYCHCGPSDVNIQAANRFLRKSQTYAVCQRCGKTTPLNGLLSK